MHHTVSASALSLLAALALAGCSTPSAAPPQAFVPATQVQPPQPSMEAAAEDPEEDPFSDKFHRDPDGDDYRAVSGMVQFSGQKTREQLEIEKIHRLAKMCIAANNVSAPCLDLIRIDARMGKFYILRESQGMSSLLKRFER